MTVVYVADGGGGGGGEFDVDTWVPGKPDDLDAIATSLDRFGTRACEIADDVSAVVAAVESTSWEGSAATDFKAKLPALPERLNSLGDAYITAAAAIADLATRARDRRKEAATAISDLIAARNAEANADAAYATAFTDYWSNGGFLNDPDGTRGDAMTDAHDDVERARDDAEASLVELRRIAKEYHEECADCARDVDDAEPESLMDRDFASVWAELMSDGRLAWLIRAWNVPLTTELDDPELDGNGEYEHRADEPLFPNGAPSPDDIVQGDLGDCWLLAVLAGIAAQNPGAIEDMVIDNGDGTYTVTFADGERVTVDADVRDSNGHALWVSLIEKAYARREGGYDDIDGGDPNDAIEALLGGDTNSFDPDSTKDFMFGDNVSPGDSYDRIEDALDDGRVVTASVRDSLGIDGGHALTVTDVYESDGEQYVVVRNPWGSHGQMEDAIKRAGGTIRSGGYFVMPVGKFADHFYKVRMQK